MQHLVEGVEGVGKSGRIVAEQEEHELSVKKLRFPLRFLSYPISNSYNPSSSQLTTPLQQHTTTPHTAGARETP